MAAGTLKRKGMNMTRDEAIEKMRELGNADGYDNLTAPKGRARIEANHGKDPGVAEALAVLDAEDSRLAGSEYAKARSACPTP
jgi:hypothetical protein